MKVLIVNTYDVQGGAAKAAYRLHHGLLSANQHSTLLSRHAVSHDETVLNITVKPSSVEEICLTCFDAIQADYIDLNRSELTNTFFSMPYPGIDLSPLDSVQSADVINLHWVARFQSPTTIKNLSALGKPIIWTLHDMWAFTGGCHFSSGCLKYQRRCSSCPQLVDDPYHLTEAILKDKMQAWADTPITIVTPSEWLADCARSSSLFRNNRIEVIPNSLEVDVFVPIPKDQAKRSLDIEPDVITILFGAGSAEEERKGLSELVQALHVCHSHPRFQTLVADHQIQLLCFGHPSDLLTTLNIPVRSLGFVTSDEQLRQIYSAADVFALPSLEDNLPNTMLEAMSCGTPVVAFNVGGVPDVVKDGVHGRLAPVRDTHAFAEALLDCIFDIDRLTRMSHACRELIEDGYSLNVQAQRYIALFQDLLDQPAISGVQSATTQSQAGAYDHQSSNNCSWMQQGMTQPNTAPTSVSLDTSVGEYSGQIFDNVAVQAMATSLQNLKADFHKAQVDLQTIHAALQQARHDLEDKQTVEHDLAEARETITNLQNQLQAQENLRTRLIHELHNRNAGLQYQNSEVSQQNRQQKRTINRLTRRLTREQAAATQTIEHLQEELARSHAEVERLQVGRVALKQVVKSLLKRLKLYGLLVPSARDSAAASADGLTDDPLVPPHPDQPDTPSQQQAKQPDAIASGAIAPDADDPAINITSPLVDALVVTRDLDLDVASDVDSALLAFFADLVSEPRQTLCIQPHPVMVSLVQSLACRGAEVMCVGCDAAMVDTVATVGVEAIALPLAEWMAERNLSTLTPYDVLCLSAEMSPDDWRSLKGRLSPEARVVVYIPEAEEGGRETEGEPVPLPTEWRTPTLKQAGFWLYDKPPQSWHDPLWPLPSIDPDMRWPWNYPLIKAAPTLPSGRPWPKISVVTVTYNQGAYLEETLRSVLLQGYPNLEYIVVDACSTDTTASILERYRKDLAHCIVEPDKGQADALNKGFKRATGDILAWLNSDDCYLPTALFRVAMAFDHYQVDLVAGGCQLRQNYSSVIFKTHHSAMPVGQIVPLPFERLMDIETCWQSGEFFYQPEVFWTRDLWERCGGYLEENLFYSMDYELWVRMAYHKAAIAHIPDPLTLFRFHEQQKTYGENIPFLPELMSVRDRYQSSV